MFDINPFSITERDLTVKSWVKIFLPITIIGGTQRIMVALLSPPPYIRYLLKTVIGEEWRRIILSRQSINNVLKRHKVNGSPYKKNKREWKFFRAECPNDMWQIDTKGAFLIDGKRMSALLILDDYSRFLISVQLFKSITTDVVTQSLDQCIPTYSRSK